MWSEIQLNTDKLTMIEYKIIKGNIETPEGFDPKQISGYNVSDDLKLAFNPDQKLVKADYSIKVETSNVSDPTAWVYFHFVFLYIVDNFQELTILKENKHIEVHPQLVNAIAAISYSTTRGILLTRLQGTVLSDFILPITNTSNLLNKRFSE